MTSWLPAITAVAAITLTYLLCIRPMRHGRCGMAPHQQPDAKLQAEITELRAEIASFRRDHVGTRGNSPGN